jgi:DNA polymerase (family 10)
MITNDEIATRFEEFADRLEAKGVEYKPRSYRDAAENVRAYPGRVATLARDDPDALREIDGVGEAIAGKIEEYVETGAIEELADLREELPVEMGALTRVEGVGPKTVGSLYEALGIEDLDDLEEAAREGEIRTVRGFGETTEQNILEGIAFAREAHERTLLGDARPLADAVLDHLRESDAVERAEVAGSIRRWAETVGDVDVLVATEDGAAGVGRFTDWPRADEVIEAGETKASVRAAGVRVDLRAVAPDEFGAALQYFTGDKQHNVALRNRAIDRGLKLNEYGAFDVSGMAEGADDPADPADADDPRAGERVAGETEAGMYEAVGLATPPPELRRNDGEIEAAAEGRLPDLLDAGSIRGDLHTHTDWSDGDASVREMVAAAAERGYDYHAVCDHGEGPGVLPNVGLSDGDLREQAAEVEAVREDAGIEVFHGVEANVDADGGIHPGGDVLADLDLVVASPHSALGQDREAATERLVAAVEHPQVDVLGHPSGRLLNQRAGLEFDAERVAEAAAREGVALEVNANPNRLDLWGEAVRTAVEAGATVAIDTDAHVPAELDFLRYGVHTARRGWAEPGDVLNARPAGDVRSFLAE